MKYRSILFLLLVSFSIFTFSSCKKAGGNCDGIVVTTVKFKDSPLIDQIGRNIMRSENPTIKDVFLALSEEYLPIPKSFRLQMLENYEIRDILRQKHKTQADSDSLLYDFEIDNLDSLRDYIMFSVFNKEKEVNYFLRYFRDTSDAPSSVIGLSKIETQNKKRSGSYLFLAQTDSLLSMEESLFPPITLTDFIEERYLQKLNLDAEAINHPPLLIWMPNRGEKVGIDLNLDAFGDPKSAVKSSCRRTHLDINWNRGEGNFDKENAAPIIRKNKKPGRTKARPAKGKPQKAVKKRK